jgi:hypothetical protein
LHVANIARSNTVMKGLNRAYWHSLLSELPTEVKLCFFQRLHAEFKTKLKAKAGPLSGLIGCRWGMQRRRTRYAWTIAARGQDQDFDLIVVNSGQRVHAVKVNV